MPNLTNILRTAVSTPWAIVPAKLDAICAVLEVRANAGHLSPQAIKAATAQRRSNRLSPATGAVAVIPISGVIAPRMNVMTEMSGGCSAEQLGQQIKDAVDNPQVGAIVLDVDSPGGQVGGIPELAAQIRAWRDVKPIVAVANHLMASAAYWLASAATEVVAAPSAEVGSIGVFTIHTDTSRADQSAGLQRTLVKAGVYKGEDLPFFALSDDAKAHMEAKVGQYFDQFVSDVAANRGVTPQAVKAGYGQGQTLVAAAAMTAGLIDRVATLDQVVAELAGPVGPSALSMAAAATRPTLAVVADAPTDPDQLDSAPGDDGAEADDAPDCPECGTPMEVDGDDYVCPNCGYAMPIADAGDMDAVARVTVIGTADLPSSLAALSASPTISASATPNVTQSTSSITGSTSSASMPTQAPRRGGRVLPSPSIPAIRVTASPAKETSMSDDMTTSASATDDNPREREIEEISALAKAHGMTEQLPRWIEARAPLDGKSGVRAEIANALRERLAQGPQVRTHRVDLNEREEKSYSYARAISSAADGSACFERDLSEELSKNLPKEYIPQGGKNSLFVPTSIRTPMDGQKLSPSMQATGLDSGTATKGAELKFVQYGGFIDLLRNKTRVLQAGARMLSGLTGPVTFAKQNGAGTFAWVGENGGADVADSNLLLTTVTLTAKTGQSTTSYSRQLLRQAVEDIESIVRNDLAAVHAVGVDLAALAGTGASNQPTGVFNQAGVGVVALGTNGAAPTYNNLINQLVQIGQANADEDIGTGAFITTPGMKGTLQTISKLANTIAEPVWADDDTVAGRKGYSTNQVQSNLTKGSGVNLHAIYYGIWQQLLIGEWGAMELLVDPLRLKKQGMIEVTSFEMIDIAVRYAAAFSIIKDAISSF